jgi:hypothetical protein
MIVDFLYGNMFKGTLFVFTFMHSLMTWKFPSIIPMSFLVCLRIYFGHLEFPISSSETCIYLRLRFGYPLVLGLSIDVIGFS